MVRDPLREYSHLLASRAIGLGLIAETDAARIPERHVNDSLRAARLPTQADFVVDIGSGAGLPGIPLAIARPDLRLVLVEARQRAVAFLELAVEQLGLHNVVVRHERIEDLELRADVATARAFGPLDRSWAAAVRILKPGGRLVYFAGASLEPHQPRSITEPEAPASFQLQESELESSGPLVIMIREE